MGQNPNSPRASDGDGGLRPGHDIDWAGVLSRVGPKLEDYFKRRSIPVTTHDVDDGLQQGISKVLDGKAVFETEKNREFDGFLFVICKNLILTALKARWKLVDPDMTFDTLRVYPQFNPDAESSKVNEQMYADVVAVLESFPSCDRAFMLDYPNMSVSEVAEKWGMTPEAARVRQFRLKTKIKKQLQGLGYSTRTSLKTRGAGNEQ